MSKTRDDLHFIVASMKGQRHCHAMETSNSISILPAAAAATATTTTTTTRSNTAFHPSSRLICLNWAHPFLVRCLLCSYRYENRKSQVKVGCTCIRAHGHVRALCSFRGIFAS